MSRKPSELETVSQFDKTTAQDDKTATKFNKTASRFGAFLIICYLCKLKHQSVMYATYIKKEVADLNGTGSTQACYKIKLSPMDFNHFVSLCQREGGWDESIIRGVIAHVSEKLALCMAEGFSVKIDGIGTFNASLGVRGDVLPDAFEEGETHRNSKTIEVKGVAYRADKDLIRNTSRKCTLVKGGESRLKKSKFSLEERVQKAHEFMKKNYFMRVPDYVRLTGLSRSKAGEELRRLERDPATGITSRGERSQKVYVLRNE